MLEVIQTSIIEDKPPPLPALPGSSLLDEPAFLVGGEKREHEIVVGLVRDLEWLLFDARVDGKEHIPWQILASIDTLVLSNELVLSDLHLDVLVVERGVEHDDGEGEDVHSVTVSEGARVLTAVVGGKHRHDSVNLLSLSWQPKAPEKLSESLNQEKICELV